MVIGRQKTRVGMGVGRKYKTSQYIDLIRQHSGRFFPIRYSVYPKFITQKFRAAFFPKTREA
jgi:hypothetical protein